MFNKLTPPALGAFEASRGAPQGGWIVYQDVLYSTIVYPQAGQAVQAPLKFFQGAEATPTDITLTNVPTGVIPGGHRFWAKRLFVTPIVETFVAGAGVIDASGLVRDLDRVLKTNRGFISYSISSLNKIFGNIPLTALGEMGGIVPDFGGNNVPAAGNNAVYQHARTVPLGGWPIDLPIQENEQFPFNMIWGVATAINAALTLRLELMGWHYVKVG